MTKEKTETNYQWNAADYAGYSEAQQKWALELMQRLDLRGMNIFSTLVAVTAKSPLRWPQDYQVAEWSALTVHSR